MFKKLSLTAMAVFFAAQSNALTLGVVDMDTLFKESHLAQSLNGEAESFYQAKAADLAKQEAAFKEEVQAYQKNVEIMTQEARNDAESALMEAQKSLQQAQYTLNQSVAKRKQEDADKFMNEVNGVLKQIAAQENLDVVLPSGLSLYFTDSLDVTQKTLSYLNRDNA